MARQIYEYHPVFAYRFIPGLKARIEHESGGYLIRTNEAGFRCNHEFSARRNPGKQRVLLFGDSFTAGDGVSNDKRYGDQLESLVPGVEVFNFGLSGTGTDQHYLIYHELAASIEHDVMVIGVLVENMRRVLARFRTYADDRGREVMYAKPYYELNGDRLELRGVPPAREPMEPDKLAGDLRGFVDQGGRFQWLRKTINRLGLRELAQRVTRYQPVPEYNSATTPGWRLMRAILEMWLKEHARRSPVILMPIPLYQYIEGTSSPRAYQARFREVAAAAGCILHDPLPDLMKYSAQERRGFRFEHDVHLTPAGHAALARSLAPKVAAAMSKRSPEG